MTCLPPDIEARLEPATRLPSLPAVVSELLVLASNNDAPLTDFATLLSRDPALCLQLLRLANSPYYRRGCDPVICCEHAVTRLGIDGTLTALLGFTLVRDATRGPLADYWRRTLAAAHLIPAIAKVVNPRQPGELSTRALLREVGVLLLYALDPNYFELTAQAATREQRLALEHRHLGCDRDQASSWLARRWQLPTNLFLQRPVDPEGQRHHEWLDGICLELADELAGCCLDDDSDAIPAVLHRFQQRMNMDGNAQARLVDELASRLETLPDFLATTLSADEDIERLLVAGKQRLHGLTMSLAERLHHREDQLISLQRDNEALDLRASTDALTGLANRAALERRLEEMLEDAHARDKPLSVLFLDLDHFKPLNDRYGHRLGDIVLVNVAATLRDAIRESDLAARYGGEEFVIALRNTPEPGALRVAQRLQQWLSEQPMAQVDQRPLYVSASIGIAQWQPGMDSIDAASLVEKADLQMYQAKQAGRARISQAEQLQERAGETP
ncbi:GGDEF domain-containing protein [Halomonas sp. EF61]|uniref:GGDEF domain-containing protein n=1 Tax=Halomonas sp. EF61 TaxID=2950869 RepID=UPI0032DF6A23